MSYTKQDIRAAAKRQETAAGLKGVAAPMRGVDGIKTRQVDAVLFHNARIANQRVYGVDNIWDEPEFCRDMDKRHPEFRVKTVSRNLTVGGRGRGPQGEGRLIPGLGRVTNHKRYG